MGGETIDGALAQLDVVTVQAQLDEARRETHLFVKERDGLFMSLRNVQADLATLRERALALLERLRR
jgi:hypothetical protein